MQKEFTTSTMQPNGDIPGLVRLPKKLRLEIGWPPGQRVDIYRHHTKASNEILILVRPHGSSPRRNKPREVPDENL